jgi:hypothetical protein
MQPSIVPNITHSQKDTICKNKSFLKCLYSFSTSKKSRHPRNKEKQLKADIMHKGISCTTDPKTNSKIIKNFYLNENTNKISRNKYEDSNNW